MGDMEVNIFQQGRAGFKANIKLNKNNNNNNNNNIFLWYEELISQITKLLFYCFSSTCCYFLSHPP
jgi:hypothetical protein